MPYFYLILLFAVPCTSSSKWHVLFASRCPGMRLSTWQMTAASCPTALDALYGQPMSRLVSYHERSAAMATEPL